MWLCVYVTVLFCCFKIKEEKKIPKTSCFLHNNQQWTYVDGSLSHMLLMWMQTKQKKKEKKVQLQLFLPSAWLRIRRRPRTHLDSAYYSTDSSLVLAELNNSICLHRKWNDFVFCSYSLAALFINTLPPQTPQPEMSDNVIADSSRKPEIPVHSFVTAHDWVSFTVVSTESGYRGFNDATDVQDWCEVMFTIQVNWVYLLWKTSCAVVLPK